MSAPISATIAHAAVKADSGDLSQPLGRRGVRGGQLLDRDAGRGDVGVDRIGPGQHRGEQERVMAVTVTRSAKRI